MARAADPTTEDDEDDEVAAARGQEDHDQTQSSLTHDIGNLTLHSSFSSSPAIPIAIPSRANAAGAASAASRASATGAAAGAESIESASRRVGDGMDVDIQVGESAAGQSVRMKLPPRALQQILEAATDSADSVMTPRNDIGPFAF